MERVPEGFIHLQMLEFVQAIRRFVVGERRRESLRFLRKVVVVQISIESCFLRFVFYLSRGKGVVVPSLCGMIFLPLKMIYEVPFSV